MATPNQAALDEQARIAAEQAARAAALQRQYNQPVTGPNGVVGQPTPLLGTDPQQVAVGLAAAQQAQTALSALPQQPVGTLPYQANAPVLAQDRANVQAFVQSQPGYVAPTDPTTLSAQTLEEANQRIAATLAGAGSGLAGAIGPLPGAADGNFNQATTSRVGANGQITSTLRQPDNIIQGGYGGFGTGGNQPQGARQYLDRMAAQDSANAATDTAARQRGIATMERIGLSRAATQGNANDRLAARKELNAFDTRTNAQTLLGTQEAGLASRANLAASTDLAKADLTGQAGITAAIARANAAQTAANTTGQYGLQAAAIKAAGTRGAAEAAANGPAGQLAAQRARLIDQQLTLAGQAAEAGDVSGTYAGLGLSRPVVKPAIDPVTGVPYTPEEVALQQQARLARIRAQQQ